MKSKKYSVWGVIVAAAVAAGAVVAAPAAPAMANNIDPAADSSLTIHKYAGPENPRGDGSEIADPSGLGTPLSGVEFTITPVTAQGGQPIDLTTQEGWDLAAAATPGDVTNEERDYTLGTPVTAVTGADGTVVSDLPLGLYLVEETGNGGHNIVDPVADFLVTLPMPNGGDWIYDVHVYPKNQLNASIPQKTVSAPTGFTIGSQVTWSIAAPVPDLNSGTYTQFQIVDPLDSRLTFNSATITTAGFAEGTDYTVATSGNTVTITFTAAGRGKLVAGGSVAASITTTVNGLGANGVVPNQATVVTNGSSVATNVATTNWGALQIVKHVQGDRTSRLADAEFAVFTDAAGENEVARGVTDDEGLANFSLWTGSNTEEPRSYWIRETRAPAGFVLDERLRQVSIAPSSAAEPVVREISNVQQNGPELPLTGAAGQLWLTVGGAALLVSAVGAAIVISRRRKQHA